MMVIVPGASSAPRQHPADEVRGVWITNSPSDVYYSRKAIKRTIGDLSTAGFNTIYPNVWSRGTTFHDSAFAPTEPELLQAGLTLDPICSLNAEARQRGLSLIHI